MLGAIAGDIIGSIYEVRNIRTTDFPLFFQGCTFTDDTVEPGKTYIYVVEAFNAVGKSGRSNTAFATVPPGDVTTTILT